MVFGKHSLGHRGRDDRATQGFGQARQARRRVAAHRGDAGEDDRAARGANFRRDVGRRLVRREDRGKRLRGDGRQKDLVVARVRTDHVGRERHVHRPGPLRHRDAHRLAQDGACSVRLDRGGPLAHRREQPLVVDHLVREEGLPPALDLPGDREHRNAVEPGVRDRVHQVGGSRAERGQAHAGKPGEHAHRFGHQARGALTARENEVETLAATGLQHFDRRVSRVAEDVAHPERTQVADHQFRDVHCSALVCSCPLGCALRRYAAPIAG